MPAIAQESTDVAEMRAEIARLRAQLQALEARLGKVETSAAAPTSARASAPGAAPPAQVAAAAPAAETSIVWKGAPQFSNGKGLTFKPRGRLQLDTDVVTRPDGINGQTLGRAADVRRAFLGVEGTLGGGLGYRLEADFANGVTFTDTWLTYTTGPLTITLGNHKTFASLDEQTSDLETSLLERAAFTQAFGFERRLGLSATYARGDIMASVGAFSDDPETQGGALTDDSYSFDGRAIYMPRVAGTQLHFAGSLHYRALQDLTNTVRYRARPGARTTEFRFVDTGMFSAVSETGYGIEFAAIRGPFHVAAEGFWQQVDRPGNLPTPTFFGGYGEIGYIFAGGKTRSYSRGAFGSIKPTRGLDNGGSGAWQINVRYDWLDLNDKGVVGGKQRTLGTSLVWVPIEHVKFLADYLHLNMYDTPILAGGRSDYDADVVGLRAQYDF
ncbi:OprO/OprP family phosphate-selective porin [Sphingobium nicotianae]|nr:porin [Sphingobium nicotianae]